MVRFIRRLLIFCLLPIPVLFGFQHMVDSGLRNSRGEFFAEWNDIYAGKVDADLVIMGSSRAWVHYSPQILESDLGLKTYNLGIDGWPFSMQKARFEIYREHNRKPRYVIQNLDLGMLTRRTDLYGFEQFLPYLNDPEIRKATAGYKGEFGYADYYFPAFKYNAKPQVAVTGLLTYLHLINNDPVKFRGYMGRDRSWDGTFDKWKAENPDGVTEPVDPTVLNEFTAYIEECKSEGIELILVYSPEYIEAQSITNNRAAIMDLFRNLAEHYGIRFIDFSNDPISFDKSNFYNSQHMNRNGSEAFSKDLAGILKRDGVAEQQ